MGSIHVGGKGVRVRYFYSPLPPPGMIYTPAVRDGKNAPAFYAYRANDELSQYTTVRRWLEEGGFVF